MAEASGAVRALFEAYARATDSTDPAFFATAGLAATEVSGIDESPLDEHHLLVRVHWAFRFERNPAPPIVEEGAATYVLRRQDSQLQIVFQLDHQDLARRAQELGLLPRQG